MNGRQIVRPAVTRDDIIRAHKDARNPANRQYATFRAADLKSGEHIEVSCDPKAVSNYFQPESSLPLEMSPVFFRGEVLLRYKADTEKYELRDRSIYCRGTWTLETYDINEAGQVHTYLTCLGNLPYQEQLYWQSFNEWPKAPLSKRAITNDFKGEVYTEYDPLNSLKHKVSKLDETPFLWWNRRGDDLVKAVHYPVTSSPTDWANEILALDQLLNEGFKMKALRAIAVSFERKVEADWGTFKLIGECLIGIGVPKDEADDAVAAFRTLRELRNVLKGHAATQKRSELEKQARTRFGSFRAHFANVASTCDSALELTIRLLVPRK